VNIPRWTGKLTLIVASCLAFVVNAAAGADASCSPAVTGDSRLNKPASKIYSNTRTIRVLLPPNYDAPENATRRYPVLYLLDGQNLFDACLSDVSHREWQVDETVYRLVGEKAIPPLIVVGIDHAGKNRAYEYLPYKDYGNGMSTEPAGKRFPDFLTDEVMPLVASQYRVLTGHPNTGIGGSSYGGVASLYALLAKPNVFGYGLIESPTLWVGMGQLVRDTGPLAALPNRVFIGFGGRESGDPRLNAALTRMIHVVESNFHAAGYDDTNFRYVFDPDALHTEDAWAKRLPGALVFLFGDWNEQPERVH